MTNGVVQEPTLPVLEKKKLWQNKKLVIVVVVLIVAVVAVVVILLISQFNTETLQKTSLLLPFLFRKR